MTDPVPAREATSESAALAVATALSCWDSPVAPEPLSGGMTNRNFVVRDGSDTFVVRVGTDLPLHGIVRDRELATCVAAHRCGLSPEVVHHEPGVLVMRYIDARTLTATDIREPAMAARVIDLVRRTHLDMPTHLEGATHMFWAFHVCRGYLRAARRSTSRRADDLADLQSQIDELEKRLGPIHPAFCHNDLLPANFLDDGESLWLLDWEYAGWNSAYFDLANLVSNTELAVDQHPWIIETYFGRPAEPTDLIRLGIMVCASLLREALWSVVQEQHSTLDFDYASYTDNHLDRYEAAYRSLGTAP